MHVLVTGGTGVVGQAAVDHLLEQGHSVRLLSRHADRDSLQWESGVEPYPASVGNDDEVRGAADGCDAVLHVAGIVEEVPPEVTFQRINVEGTRRMVQEAERAGVTRFVYVSSLGADRGASSYHESKRAGEEIVQTFPGEWLICRPGNVYGPGDEVVSLLLKMVRTLPVVPVVGSGDQPFQPIAAEDLGAALARAVEGRASPCRILEIAGDEQVTLNQLLDLLEEITDQHPARVPVPEAMAMAGAQVAEALGLEIPVHTDQIVMLLEENVIPPERENALTEVFGVVPRPLRQGLQELASSLPEKLPSDGIGELQRQRYWADIANSRSDADELFTMVRLEFHALVPENLMEVGAEPGSPISIEEGATFTMGVPLRGHIQVRVEEVMDRAITCATLEGHHLAGVIRYFVEELEGLVRFEVRSYSRSARLLDQLGMEAVGRRLQAETWRSMVEEVVRRSGGRAVDGVQAEIDVLSEEEAEGLERWSEDIVLKRRRTEKHERARS